MNFWLVQIRRCSVTSTQPRSFCCEIEEGEEWNGTSNHCSHTDVPVDSCFIMASVITFKKRHTGFDSHTISPTHLEALEACYSAVPISAHYRIAFHHLHLNIFMANECLLCFQTVLGNAVHSHNSCQRRVLVNMLLMSHFCKFIPLLQYICDLTKLKNIPWWKTS